MKFLAHLMTLFLVLAELIGDITEDYAERRSLPRLLLQFSVAIATTVPRDLWSHARLSLCALETGWILYFFWSQLQNSTMLWWVEQPYQFTLAIGAAVAFSLGWIVSRIQDRQPLGAVILFLMPLIVMQATSDIHHISTRLVSSDAAAIFRFVEVQLWTAWTPLLIAFLPALFAKPQRFSKP